MRLPESGFAAMSERPYEQLSLRDLFTSAELLIREVVEHLEQSFLPKVHSVEEVVRPGTARDREEIADSTIRIRVGSLLESDDYTRILMNKLEQCLSTIQVRSRVAVGGK
jgi:hypothetical protein